MKEGILDWIKGIHNLEPDRFLFSMYFGVYTNQDESVLHIVVDNNIDDGLILPVRIHSIIQAETGIKTFYKHMLGFTLPSCFTGKPEFIYWRGKNV